MNNRVLLKRLVKAGLLFGLLAIAIFVAQYFLSLRVVTVNFQNVSRVDIYKTKKLDSGKDQDPYKTILTSGEEIKIPKGDYTAYYQANKGYESKYQEFSFDDDYILDIKPNYSEDKLNEILNQQINNLNRTIESYSSNISSQYTIQKGQLFDNGNWYGTTLVYKGDDYFNNDTLRVVLKKNGNTWVVAGKPSIYFNKFDYANIPKNILSEVNTL